MGVFNKEKRGMNCQTDPTDNSVVCRRFVKNPKTGELLTDGQTARISADPSNNCQPRFETDLTILDDEFPEFEKIAKRVSAGCQRNSQPQSQPSQVGGE